MGERVNRSLAETVRALLVLYRQNDGRFVLPHSVWVPDVLRLLRDALGDELYYFENAQDAIWEVARHMGYKVSASPVESAGDALAFLQEAGVANADEWYRARGVSDETMHNLYAASCFISRNEPFWRKLIVVPRLSGDAANELAPYAIEALDFALSTTTLTTDQTLFMC